MKERSFPGCWTSTPVVNEPGDVKSVGDGFRCWEAVSAGREESEVEAVTIDSGLACY